MLSLADTDVYPSRYYLCRYAVLVTTSHCQAKCSHSFELMARDCFPDQDPRQHPLTKTITRFIIQSIAIAYECA
jgi:hypothetical protein